MKDKNLNMLLLFVIMVIVLAALGSFPNPNIQQSTFCAKAAAEGIPGDGCK